MEIHTIILNSKEYQYKLYYKRIKSIYIKVINNEIVVSAPCTTSLKTIESLINEYKDKLISKIDEYEPYAIYKNNGKILIFNQWYTIRLIDINERRCAIHDHQLYVYHHDLIKTIDSCLKQLLLDYIEERIIFYLSRDFDLDMFSIQVKLYKSKWGCCYYKENKFSFNWLLIHLDKELIDYVIVHELTHFIEANHSSKFYKEIEKRIPDYKIRIKKLKEKHI